MHYDDEVYYVIKSEIANSLLIDMCLYASQATWHSLCVVTESDIECQTEKTLTIEVINDICNKICLVIAGAYDGEGYVFWKKMDSIICYLQN